MKDKLKFYLWLVGVCLATPWVIKGACLYLSWVFPR